MEKSNFEGFKKYPQKCLNGPTVGVGGWLWGLEWSGVVGSSRECSGVVGNGRKWSQMVGVSGGGLCGKWWMVGGFGVGWRGQELLKPIAIKLGIAFLFILVALIRLSVV